jgi:hypothetical protein
MAADDPAKKDRTERTMRSKSREETPKEGMDRSTVQLKVYAAMHKSQAGGLKACRA